MKTGIIVWILVIASSIFIGLLYKKPPIELNPVNQDQWIVHGLGKLNLSQVLDITSSIDYSEDDPINGLVFHPPVQTLARGSGDCKDHSALAMQLLYQFGIEATYVVVNVANGDTTGLHAIISVNGHYYDPEVKNGEIYYPILSVERLDNYQEMVYELSRLMEVYNARSH